MLLIKINDPGKYSKLISIAKNELLIRYVICMLMNQQTYAIYEETNTDEYAHKHTHAHTKLMSSFYTMQSFSIICTLFKYI